MPEINDQERHEFLKRQGWHDDLTPDEKQKIEQHWTDADIDMATGLNLA